MALPDLIASFLKKYGEPQHARKVTPSETSQYETQLPPGMLRFWIERLWRNNHRFSATRRHGQRFGLQQNGHQTNCEVKMVELTFTRAKAVAQDEIIVVSSRDEDDPGYPFTRIGRFSRGRWTFQDLDFWVSDLAEFHGDKAERRDVWALTRTGQALPLSEVNRIETIVNLKPDHDPDPFLDF
jgi:hypothetical protein